MTIHKVCLEIFKRKADPSVVFVFVCLLLVVELFTFFGLNTKLVREHNEDTFIISSACNRRLVIFKKYI